MTKRRSRDEMAAANRRAVLAAARQQFERHGYHGASLDGIAEAAGFSKGAVYSRFEGKDDLFLAVLADHIDARHEATMARFGEMTGPEHLPRLVEWAVGVSVESVAWQAALLEFRAHAWRHPEVNTRYIELHRRTIDSIARAVAELFERGDAAPPLPVELIAVVGLANGTGVVAEYMADPSLDVAGIAAALAHSVTATGRAELRSTP